VVLSSAIKSINTWTYVIHTSTNAGYVSISPCGKLDLTLIANYFKTFWGRLACTNQKQAWNGQSYCGRTWTFVSEQWYFTEHFCLECTNPGALCFQQGAESDISLKIIANPCWRLSLNIEVHVPTSLRTCNSQKSKHLRDYIRGRNKFDVRGWPKGSQVSEVKHNCLPVSGPAETDESAAEI